MKKTPLALSALLFSSLLGTLPLTAGQNAIIPTPASKESAPAQEDAFHKNYRSQKYEAYPPVKTTSSQLKINNYNQFENPMGIVFSPGETIVVEAGPSGGIPIELKIADFSTEKMTSDTYPLKPGKNTIEVKNAGHGYISYYTDNWQKAPKVKITVLSGGQANGYFDNSFQTNEDWKKLLDGAVSPIMDIKGKYVQLAYPVQALREQCPEDGLELIGIYDKIIDTQHYILGFDKYKCRPKNRMFGRVIWKGFMHADGIGAAFHNSTMKKLANIAEIKKDPWGIAHEFGHVNQTRPGMKWAGTGELTNNIFSIWTKYLFSPEYINLEHHKKNDTFGNNVEGGRFNAYLNSAIIAEEPWLALKGPDKMKDYGKGNGDHFVKLCPLWQLMLYFQVAGKGNPDLFPDIFHIVRRTDESKLSHGQLQLNFLKNLCDVTKQNLTDFFRATGMLRPIDSDVRDYGDYHITITQDDCDKLARYAAKYPKPESPVIQYITSSSVNAYKNRLPVTGEFGKGVTEAKDSRLISDEVWKNVTVFETYHGNKLERLAIVHTGSPDKTGTVVPYPEGSTRIEAVAWDGTRTLVCGKR